MRCSKAIQLMEFKLNRELASSRVQALERHLADCPACRAYRRLSEQLSQFLSPDRSPEFPTWVHHQILDQAAGHDRKRRSYTRRWKLQAIPALMAAVLCLYVGSLVGKAAYSTVKPFPVSGVSLASGQADDPALFGESALIEPLLTPGISNE